MPFGRFFLVKKAQVLRLYTLGEYVGGGVG